MKHFNKILCPYDFSSYADEALLYAIKLADNHTQITLLNVIQLPYLIDPNGFTFYDHKAEEIQQQAAAEMDKKLANLRLTYVEKTFDFAIETDEETATAILHYQQTQSFDLIVIGSHGRKGLERLLMGSIAESVLREATCPVLIIKHK